jgi:hypothetical protein
MKAARRQFLVRVDGIDGLFGTKTGGEVTSDTTKVFDGGARYPDVISSPPQVSDITVTRPYDPDRDQAVANVLKPQVGALRTTISVQPTQTDLTAAKVPGDVYPNALLTGVKLPEPDSSSGDGATLELTFAVGSIS